MCELKLGGKAANMVFIMIYSFILLPCAVLYSAQKTQLGPGVWKTKPWKTNYLRKSRKDSIGEFCLRNSNFLTILCIKWDLEMEGVRSWARQPTGNSRQEW